LNSKTMGRVARPLSAFSLFSPSRAERGRSAHVLIGRENSAPPPHVRGSPFSSSVKATKKYEPLGGRLPYISPSLYKGGLPPFSRGPSFARAQWISDEPLADHFGALSPLPLSVDDLVSFPLSAFCIGDGRPSREFPPPSSARGLSFLLSFFCGRSSPFFFFSLFPFPCSLRLVVSQTEHDERRDKMGIRNFPPSFFFSLYGREGQMET